MRPGSRVLAQVMFHLYMHRLSNQSQQSLHLRHCNSVLFAQHTARRCSWHLKHLTQCDRHASHAVVVKPQSEETDMISKHLHRCVSYAWQLVGLIPPPPTLTASCCGMWCPHPLFPAFAVAAFCLKHLQWSKRKADCDTYSKGIVCVMTEKHMLDAPVEPWPDDAAQRSVISQVAQVPAKGGAQPDRPGHQVSLLLFLREPSSSLFCSFCCSNMIFFAISTCTQQQQPETQGCSGAEVRVLRQQSSTSRQLLSHDTALW